MRNFFRHRATALPVLIIILFANTVTKADALFNYDDCVIQGMKGVSSDRAAQEIKTACNNKKSNAIESRKKQLQEKYGSPLTLNESERIVSSYSRISTSSFSIVYVNNTDLLVTGLELEVSDDQLELFESLNPTQANSSSKTKLSYLVQLSDPLAIQRTEQRNAWQAQHKHRYLYRVHIQPGEKSSLRFSSASLPKHIEVRTAIGRSLTWVDKFTSATTTANPCADESCFD